MQRRLATTIEPDLANATDFAANEEDLEPEIGPLRRCILTRARLPKEQMFRFVVGPDRAMVFDLGAKLPGRGIWLSASGDVLEASSAKANAQRNLTRAFARAARGPVTVPPDLPDLLEAALIRRIGEIVGLARRAGQAVAGFEKAREWTRTGQAKLVLHACDGSEAERLRFLSGHGSSVTVLDPLPKASLGRIFGRDFAVHVAIKPGRLAETLTIEARRLAGLRRRSQETGRQGSADSNVESGANG
jgi:predicted RNA-binding protein YlxR (DUF448 family)